MREFPLIIIGAGPAGLSTAMHLLRMDPGWADRMVILERAAHPRHKLCGGGVTRLGLRCLSELDLPHPLPLPQAPVRDARFIYRDRTVHVYGRPEFVVFHRQEFDHYMAQTARKRGVRIHENAAVREIRIEDGGVRLATDRGSYRARAIVGADGSKGISRRFMKANRPAEGRNPNARRGAGGRRPARVARLLEVVLKASPGAPQFEEAFARFDFTPASERLQGYAWDFPSHVGGSPHHNRGVYDARIAPHRPRAPLPDVLKDALHEHPRGANGAPVQGHPIRWFSPWNRFSSERLLLAGDAAGAEPLFGEGIAPALGYGRIAARTLAAAYSRDDFAFSDYKRRLLGSQLGRYMLLRWGLAWWSYRLSDRPWFMHAMWTIGKGLALFTKAAVQR